MNDNNAPDLVRRMQPADLAEVLAWRNHPDIRRYMYNTREIALDEHCQWFGRASQDPRKHLLIYEAGAVSRGFVHFTELAHGRVADWGFYASPDAPKGTGRRLGAVALEYAFMAARLDKICGQALSYNDRSIRFHLAMGFHQEGVLREQHFDGTNYHDVICFGLLRREWHLNIQ